jgi:protein deglycase
MNKTALVLLHNEFEEIEAVTPIDLLHRASVNVSIVSREAGLEVTGRSGIVIRADVLLDQVIEKEYDCVVLPGGPGYIRLRNDQRVINLVQKQVERGKLVAAICAAPIVLKDAGVLDNKSYTVHFSVEQELPGAIPRQAVVEDGNIITSCGAGAAVQFALALVARLAGKEKAEQVAASI